MKGPLCMLLLLAFTTSGWTQKTSNRRMPALPSLSSYDEPRDIICFPPPDDHNVSAVIGTCKHLFRQFTNKFGDKADQNLFWSGNNSRWHDPSVIHLPKVEVYIDQNNTKACLLEITDMRRMGDEYTPNSVTESGLQVLQTCFEKDWCGEIALLPAATTILAVCGSVHRNGTQEPIPVVPGPVIPGPYVKDAFSTSNYITQGRPTEQKDASSVSSF